MSPSASSFGVQRAPQTILFGAGQRRTVPRLAAQYGKRVLVCGDERLAADPLLSTLLGELRATGIEVLSFERTIAELPLSCILECVETARNFRPDVVIGLGGGSCIDIAKLTAALLVHPGPPSLYYGEMKLPGRGLPLIAVPTTAGTGSEVTPVAVMSDPERALKVGISSPHLVPIVAVCDPDLTMSCPRDLTAIAGADAVTHAIEAYTAISRWATPELALDKVFVGKNAISDHHALSALTLLARALPRAHADGADGEARSDVMLGALLAGLAFGVAGTAAAHAIQYPVGALTKTAHGTGVALLMPHVMRFNRDFRVPELARIGRILDPGFAGPDSAAADRAIDATTQMFAGLGIPTSLAALGVPADRLDWIAAQSMLSTRLVDNNPRPLSEAAILQLVKDAYHG